MRVVIPDDYQDVVRTLHCFEKLAGHHVTIFTRVRKDLDAMAHDFRHADGLVLIRERTRIDELLLSRLPRLKLISQTGKGTAHIDLEACARHGVTVATGTGSPYAPAELTFALILAAMRRLPQEIASLHAGRWQSGLGTTVRGRTLGIYGYGRVGTLVARFGRAFGMSPLVWGREGSLGRARQDGVSVASSKRDLFERSDVLSLHLRLTPETRGVVTPPDLAAMKKESLLVNTSRAELIQPGALVDALRTGHPGGAAVDVFDSEPAGADDPLLQLENVVCTPHLGYVERDSYELYFGEAFDNIVQFATARDTQTR